MRPVESSDCLPPELDYLPALSERARLVELYALSIDYWSGLILQAQFQLEGPVAELAALDCDNHVAIIVNATNLSSRQ
jgi:hypothetical protein